jgi:hypothetical protein
MKMESVEQQMTGRVSMVIRCQSHLLIKWLICLIVIFGLNQEVGAQRAERRQGGIRPQTPVAASEDDRIIDAESKRVEAQSLAERKQAERMLMLRDMPAQTPSEALLQGFRHTFPFHIQVLALSDAAPDGSRTLIISEPPPHVTLEQILLTIGDAILGHDVKPHEVGYDGWVKDVVIKLKGNDDEVSVLLSALNRQLFFTSYKSYVMPLPVKVTPQKYDLDLKVTASEIRSWIVNEQERFIPVEGGEALTLAQLSSRSPAGVYSCRRRGLVAWWIPKGASVRDSRIEARQFALDSDLIVGAISNGSGILALGRERIVPVDILPPLRVETLMLLADVQQGQAGELKQSYERTRPFAGRTLDGRDWAPILLSPELRDTEYGSLLNITDQLLKGWSNNGVVRYTGFEYPQPERWPFPKPLFEMLNVTRISLAIHASNLSQPKVHNRL